MPKLTVAANGYRQTHGQTDPNYRIVSFLR